MIDLQPLWRYAPELAAERTAELRRLAKTNNMGGHAADLGGHAADLSTSVREMELSVPFPGTSSVVLFPPVRTAWSGMGHWRALFACYMRIWLSGAQ